MEVVQVRSPGGATEAKQTQIVNALQTLLQQMLPDDHAVQISNLAELEGLAVDTGLQQALTNVELRAQPVSVQDDYASVEHAPDQPGQNGVLSFNFSGTGVFVIVDVDNDDLDDYRAYRCRATLDGSDPDSSTGFVCRSGQATYLPFASSALVKVWAPAGVTVSVQLGRR